jgi:hypothetical protein
MMTSPSRYYWSLAIFGLGIALSAIATFILAAGRLASEPITLDSLGIIESIQLPTGARRFVDINSFIVGMNSVDDFARVFVNNYLLLMGEFTNEKEICGTEKRSTKSI